MTEIRFYHLQRSKLEQALPAILSQAHTKGMTALVKFNSEGTRDHMDETLWTFDPISFLPHGVNGAKSESSQPILLTTEDQNPNKANLLILVDGVEHSGIEEFDLCCEIFDGMNETVVKQARTKWKVLKEKGYTLKYYQQNDAGKWEEKASENAA